MVVNLSKEKVKRKQIEMVAWYNNPNLITTFSIIILVLIIVLSQSFAVKNAIGASNILRNLLNHNSIYVVGLLYFIPLKTKTGKKYFDFLNVFMIIIYGIFTATSILTVIQSFGLISLVTLGVNVVFLIYMIHSLLYKTRIWQEFKLQNSPLNDVQNINYFYTIIILSIIVLTVNLIQTSTIDGAILSALVTIYEILLARYIYLYKEHVEYKEKAINNKDKGEA